jgi:hypothetical protein
MGGATQTSRDQKARWMARREAELAAQRVTIRCAHCTGRRFQTTGVFHSARARFHEHMQAEHPDVPLQQLAGDQRTRLRIAGRLKTSGVNTGYYGRREFSDQQELDAREQLRTQRRREDAA